MSEAAAASDKDKAPAPAKSNKLLLLIVLVFNVLIAGGLAYVVISGQQKPAAAKGKVAEGHGEEEAEHAEEEEEEEGDAHGAHGKFGPLLEVGTFVANLGNPSAKSYLKVSLHVEAVNEESKAKVEAALVPIRSEALLFLSGITPDQAVGQDKIRALQDELKKRLDGLVGKKTIKRVYFSEFVVQ